MLHRLNYNIFVSFFIGGCFVEGNWLRNAFRWKETIGPWEERPGHYGDVWNYWTDDGLGYYEFLLVNFGLCYLSLPFFFWLHLSLQLIIYLFGNIHKSLQKTWMLSQSGSSMLVDTIYDLQNFPLLLYL